MNGLPLLMQSSFRTNIVCLRVALIYRTVSIVALVKIFRARVEKGDELCNSSVSCKS